MEKEKESKDPKDYNTVIMYDKGKEVFRKTRYVPRYKPPGVLKGALEGFSSIYSDLKSGAVTPFGFGKKKKKLSSLAKGDRRK